VTVPRRGPAAPLLKTSLLKTAVLTGALVLVAGCGGAAAPAPAAAPTTLAVDPALRAQLPEDVRAAGVLTVANDPSYPPASSFAADGRTIVGFEPDLLAAAGQLLGVRVEFRDADFDSMLTDLQAHRFDLVMSAVTHTAEREQQADFVTYFRAGTSIVVRRGNPEGVHDLAGLCGHVVAVEAGTTQVDLVRRSQDSCSRPIEVHALPTNDDALLELRTGRAAAVLADYPPAVFVTTDARTQNAYQLVSDVQYEPGQYGIAVPRDRTALRDALAAALQRLVESGRYQQVLDRWDVGHGAVDVVTVNGTAPVAG
jgi:polar amino acid transport system substrate-binding protein